MSRSRFTQRHIEEPLINLTPLIDVVFVILIMFIVVAPMLELDRIELADAGSDDIKESIAVQEASTISIHVHKDNRITFNNRSVTVDQLPELLRQAKKQFPSARPQLFHDKHAHFGIYQSVKNAAESAGFQHMDIVLKP
ncbi:MAG: biopolymer transporter ExbD [Parachlamydiaceae bacterium]|nr:biopolymer transporter ExbD [Parachlamydiaceae bacterium]